MTECKRKRTDRILVTGGTGFIGGYVYRHLQACGFDVTNFDLKKDNRSNDNFITGSILDFDAVQKAVDKTDIVFHFAGFSNINLVKENPKQCIELNIMGTINILEAIRMKGSGRFFFASSVYVHNKNGHFYTTSKLASELICNNYSQLYEIPTTILRLGTVYGEQSRHDDVVSMFVKRACAGEPIDIHGSGKQKRHFIHGEDVAKACKLITEKRVDNTTLILASQYGTTINELADVIKQNIPNVVINRLENSGREDDYQGDIGNSKLEETFKVLDWRPEVDINEGVKRLIKHFA